MVDKFDLGDALLAIDVHHMEDSTKKMVNKTQKHEKDKKELKKKLHLRGDYIDAIHISAQ